MEVKLPILLTRSRFCRVENREMAAAMLTRRDIDALKEYVSAPGNFGQNQAESTVRLHVTHSNLKAEFIELRLDLHVSLSIHPHKIEAFLSCYYPDEDTPVSY